MIGAPEVGGTDASASFLRWLAVLSGLSELSGCLKRSRLPILLLCLLLDTHRCGPLLQNRFPFLVLLFFAC